MLRATIIILAAALTGCGGLREERWDDEVAKVSCKTLRRCDPITFWRDYGSTSACVDATDPGDYTFCAYDPDAAAECLSAMKWSCRKIGRRYDDLVERCDAVWTCAAPETTTETDTGA
jgi:hypothetical protein